MSDWQDIETAPKDGTVIDLFVKGKRVADCYWSFARDGITGKALVDPHWDGWCCDVGKPAPNSWNPYPNLISGNPTHWMPRPKSPKGRKVKE